MAPPQLNLPPRRRLRPRPAPPAAPSREEDIDEALRESFPASDPPFWTLGRDRGLPAPELPGRRGPGVK